MQQIDYQSLTQTWEEFYMQIQINPMSDIAQNQRRGKTHGLIATLLAAAVLAACSEERSTTVPATSEAPIAAAEVTAEVAEEFSIDVPAGSYGIDRTHANMGFSVPHMGLSNYVARFATYDVSVDLDPENIAASSVSVTIDAGSITTDYDGDYKGTHANSPFDSWDEDLARSDKFFDADNYPQISFVSTSVEPLGSDQLRINGDLTLRGQTHPIVLDARVVGAVAEHPFTSAAAVGFSAQGSFARSEFGMTHLLSPPFVGDEVTLQFDGEFHQAAAE
ncbi:MAG: YceI family protein [Pseudomonadota bacterium]